MSKRLFILAWLLIYFISGAIAQKYIVYSMMGNIEVIENSKGRKLKLRDNLTPQTIIHIPERSCVVLFDEAGSRQYTLKQPCQKTVKAMIANSNNNIKTLTKSFLMFMRNQISGSGSTYAMNCSDPACVTRQLDVDETYKKELLVCGYADNYDSFYKQTNDEFTAFADNNYDDFNTFVETETNAFEKFRKEETAKFAEFVRKEWKNIPIERPVKKPVMEDLPPLTFPKADENKIYIKQNPVKIDIVVTPIEFIVPQQQPQPAIEIDIEYEKKNSVIQTLFNFKSFGTEYSVHLINEQKFHLISIKGDSLANALIRMSESDYNDVIVDVLDIRKKYKMCDWAYYCLLHDLGDAYFGQGTNEATLMTFYLLQQSGFQVRLATNNDILHILVGTRHFMYDRNYYKFNNINYFLMTGDGYDSMRICNVPYIGESIMSLMIDNPPVLEEKQNNARVIKSNRSNGLSLNVSVNQNLLDFYATYPTSEVDDNIMTRWAMYANTPLSESVKKQIYGDMRHQLEGKSQREQVQAILTLVQTGLQYEYDDSIWGGDRAFFAEETLHYPYADCEDRSILLTRLVRDLLGLDCILIYYPGHLASGVCFTEDVGGDFCEVDGKKFIVCDGTYIGSSVGSTMPCCKDLPVQAIILNKE